MSNPLYYLAGLLLVASYPMGWEPLAFAQRDAALAPWAVLGAWVFYALLCWAVLGRPRRPPQARFLLPLAALALHAELIFIFHLPLWVWQRGVEEHPLASTILSLFPLFGLFAILAVVNARTAPHGSGMGFGFRTFVGLSL